MLTSDPELGDYCCHADEEGTPLLPVTVVRRAVDAARHAVTAGVAAAAAFAELDRLTGEPWWRRLAELRTQSTADTTVGVTTDAA